MRVRKFIKQNTWQYKTTNILEVLTLKLLKKTKSKQINLTYAGKYDLYYNLKIFDIRSPELILNKFMKNQPCSSTRKCWFDIT
jgi:hypothetical protein